MTDSFERSAVAACMSLRQHGYRVGLASSDSPAPVHWSRFGHARHRVSDPRENGRRFTHEIADLVRLKGYRALLPGSDASLVAISRNRDVFDESFVLGLPPAEVVDRCVSKLELNEVAEVAGLAGPRTIVIERAEEAAEAAEELGYPLLLKPRCTVFEQDGRLTQRGSTMIGDRPELEEKVGEFGLPCLLQACEEGSLISFSGVMTADGPLAIALSRYSRTWKPEAGSVSFSQTEEPPASLVDAATGMLAELGWEGMFELEMIETAPRTYAVIDFNPRLYGSVALAIEAGAPLPAIWCDWLLRRERVLAVGRPGYSYRWEDAELRNLFAFLRQGRFGAAVGVVRPRRRLARAYFHWTDPGPLFARALAAFRRGGSGKRRASGKDHELSDSEKPGHRTPVGR